LSILVVTGSLRPGSRTSVEGVHDGRAWLTPEQLAARLTVPKATLYQWRHKGDGPRSCRIGRHLRYRLDDVEAWERSLEERDRARR
jgi:excisionase family DNA binding protein